MSSKSRQEYFNVLRERYQNAASKKERMGILDEAVSNTGLHRKSIIRSLNVTEHTGDCQVRAGRPRKYIGACTDWLIRFYRESEFVCSDKLKAMMPVLLLQWRGPIDVQVRRKLRSMSPASIDRYLKKYRGLQNRKRNSQTRPGSMIFKKMIPLKTLGTTAPRAGYLQGDTVAHGGASVAGEFIWSLTMTDERVGWTENRACFGKCAKNVLPAIESIHMGLPFELVAINFDNGSEFLNNRVYEYFLYLAERKVIPFPMSRSRSYKKNDNCHVEQKNWTSVRQIFGYDRLDHKEMVPMMNEIYRIQNLISNYFVPQFKLKSKVRVEARIKKQYDELKTPYERLLNEQSVSDENKRRLRETYAKLNYYDLKTQKEELLARFDKTRKELNSSRAG